MEENEIKNKNNMFWDLMFHFAKPFFFSFLACFSALVLSLLCHHFFNYLAIKLLGYDCQVINSWIIASPLDTQLWSLQRVMLVNGLGSFLCIIIALYILNYLKNITSKYSKVRLFLLWFSINSISLLNANLILGIINYGEFSSLLYMGFKIIYAWMYFPKVLVGVLAFMAIVFQVFISTLYVKQFLVFMTSKSEVKNTSARINTLVNLGIVPLAISALFYLLLSAYPIELYFNSIRIVLLSISLSVIYMSLTKKPTYKFEKLVSLKRGKNAPLFLITFLSIMLLIFWNHL